MKEDSFSVPEDIHPTHVFSSLVLFVRSCLIQIPTTHMLSSLDRLLLTLGDTYKCILIRFSTSPHRAMRILQERYIWLHTIVTFAFRAQGC